MRTKYAAARMAALALGVGAAAFALVKVVVGLGPDAVAASAALSGSAAAVAGYLLCLRDGPLPAHTRTLLFHVTDELAQYRAFTRLVRDQGQRITEITTDAATAIVSGLSEMDAGLGRLAEQLDTAAPDADLKPMASAARAIGEPVVGMLGKLQFQDVTQQQIAFIARLSLLVDDHMILLAEELGDRRSMDRVGRFQEMFAQALDDCVMDSQRDDHHTAMGLKLQENSRPMVELF